MSQKGSALQGGLSTTDDVGLCGRMRVFAVAAVGGGGGGVLVVVVLAVVVVVVGMVVVTGTMVSIFESCFYLLREGVTKSLNSRAFMLIIGPRNLNHDFSGMVLTQHYSSLAR